MKPFWDLMPCRIEQAATSGPIRKLRARWQRSRLSSSPPQLMGQRRRLFVDLAVISRHDAGTGIQRVVRALALALIDENPADWDVRFVAADRRRPYHVIAWPDASKLVGPEDMTARPGDLFLGLDFSLDTVRRYRRQLTRFQRDGGRLWFLVCDLLPVERPKWFSPNNVLRYKAWLDAIASLAEGFLCISGQTEEDLRRVMAARYGLSGGYRTSVVPMGHDIRESLLDPVAVADSPVRFDTSLPFSLMVGTLEPRKGHADILAAFSELWRQGADDRLVLVGRMGWGVEGLRDAIRTHPEHGGKLLWFDDVDDLELECIYQACQGVIIASHAEGFGLPLIEALGHDKPVLARDLPIFRIHERLGVRYFPADASPAQIGACVRQWVDHAQEKKIQILRPSASWELSAQVLLSAFA
ncbi:glycosyl transferase [Sphingobium quisquiliarum P25]|uniref:Glycosyl transferase n=1 Tax=Sphingobium quisquiliarum P25 TaxID=1329909 RepID=T0HSV7_9SPHN|nr:glycosyltransferase [Sphingobium quisquiliarum]EQB00639.1 glycosyl transferase [Sphingobium quisquiliarum P25]